MSKRNARVDRTRQAPEVSGPRRAFLRIAAAKRAFCLAAARADAAGSPTPPPPSEGPTWTVYREPIDASPAQIKQFAALFSNNARPVQKVNRRFVIEAN